MAKFTTEIATKVMQAYYEEQDFHSLPTPGSIEKLRKALDKVFAENTGKAELIEKIKAIPSKFPSKFYSNYPDIIDRAEVLALLEPPKPISCTNCKKQITKLGSGWIHTEDQTHGCNLMAYPA